jgi:hypothetical protein
MEATCARTIHVRDAGPSDAGFVGPAYARAGMPGPVSQAATPATTTTTTKDQRPAIITGQPRSASP